jgi:hypothetical protein
MKKKVLVVTALVVAVIVGIVFGYKKHQHKYGFWTERHENFSIIHYKNRDKAIADVNGKIISDRFDYLALPYESKPLSYVIFKGDKRGFISSLTGETLFKPEVFVRAWIDNPQYGLAAVVDKDQKLGFVDVRTKKVAIPLQFDYEDEHVNYDFIFKDFNGRGVCIVPGKNDTYGIIDTTGEIILPILYNQIDFLQHNYLRIVRNGKYALLDSAFNVVLPLEYDYLAVNDLGIVADQNDYANGHKQYLLAFNGKDVINKLWLDPVEYEELVTPLYEPVPEKYDNNGNRIYGARSLFSMYQIDDRYGVFDEKYSILIPSKYESIEYLGKGYFSCFLNGKGAIVNSKGEFVHSK